MNNLSISQPVRSYDMLLRMAAVGALLGAALLRLAGFHGSASFPIPLSSLVFRDALLVAPYLFPALSMFILPRSIVPSAFIFALSIVLAGSGLLLDRWHLAHLSKESAFDFGYYSAHFGVSFVATGFLLAMCPNRPCGKP
jgi:hypothetical protein